MDEEKKRDERSEENADRPSAAADPAGNAGREVAATATEMHSGPETAAETLPPDVFTRDFGDPDPAALREEILFRVKNPLGEREARALADYSSRKFTICFAICIPVIFLMLAWALGFADHDLAFGIAMCVIAAASIPAVVIGFPALVRKNTVRSLVSADAEAEFIVTETKILSRAFRGDRVFSSAELNVGQLVRAVGYKNYLFVYISNTQAYILDTACFTVGTPEDFAEYLRSHGVPVFGKGV